VTIYGSRRSVKDLIAARIAVWRPIAFEAEVTGLGGLDGRQPTIRYMKDGSEHTLTCDVIAGCDGFHGVCRPGDPAGVLTTYDHIFRSAGSAFSPNPRDPGDDLCQSRSRLCAVQPPLAEDFAALCAGRAR
jgi:hypothetical protein